MHHRLPSAFPALGLLLWALSAQLACSQHQPFDSVGHLQQRLQEESRLSAAEAARIAVPFALDPETLAELAPLLGVDDSARFRVQEVQDYLHHELGLVYTLRPTRDAVGTLRTREANCLSFANLFIALTRAKGLNSFYVEVQNRQRFVYRDRSVISQGHIVAGIRLEPGFGLHSKPVFYENLPYGNPDYRSYEEIDDLTATAHYYNNLGAEALLEDELAEAERLLRLAVTVDPTFASGLSNLGIVLTRQERYQQAIEVLEQGLAAEPGEGTLISNLARTQQLAGNLEEAARLLDRLEEIEHASPFFYIYRGEQALDRGETILALDYMKEALRRNNEIPEVHIGLAKVFFAIGDLRRTRFHSQRALRLDATHEEARRFAEMLSLHDREVSP